VSWYLWPTKHDKHFVFALSVNTHRRCHHRRRVSHFRCPERIFYAIPCRTIKLGVVVHHVMAQCHAP